MAKLKRKTLKKVSKQLTKASKMHAGQSKKIAKLAESLQEGGYPKSDKKDFMKRMGYYQGGGLAAPPMYGANTIPGSQETAAVTYTEADPAKLKALEEQLKETQESTQYMDEAKANTDAQAAKIAKTEQGLSMGIKGLDKLGAFDKLKQKGIDKAANLATQNLIKQSGMTLGKQSAGELSKTLAPKLFEKTAMSAVPSTSSLPSNLANFSTQPLQLGQTSTSLVNPSLGQQGANLLNTGTTAATSAASSGLSVPTLGTVAAIGGQVLKSASDDQDATTLNAGETAGSVISGAGKGIGAALTAGTLLGSSVGPVGTVAGAILGAGYGIGKSLIQRNKARKEEGKAEKKQERDENKLATAQKLEALKSRTYSGYDMGSDIARYGGYYQMGGVQLPGMIQNMAQKKMNTPMSEEDRARYSSLQMGADASNYLATEGTMAGFKGSEEKSDMAKAGKFIAKEGILDKAFHGLGRFAGVPGLMLHPMSAGASTVRDPYGVPTRTILTKNRDGGVKLPGGMAKPIPGSDAIEFKGKSHEQGGIMVDPNTEVEGNETMDKVTMKNGGKNDYFFSQHLKLGGKSFAQRHKDILKNGGSQKDIDALAKVQEKKAGRNPNDVKLGAGGYKTFQLGGNIPVPPAVLNTLTQQGPSYFENQNISVDDLSIQLQQSKDIMSGKLVFDAATNSFIPVEESTNNNETEEKATPTTTTTNKKTRKQPANTTKSTTQTGYPDADGDGVPDAIDPDSTLFNIPIVTNNEGFRMDGVEDANMTMGPEEFDYNSLSQEDKNVIDKVNSNQELTDLEKKALKRLNRDVPALAIGAGAAQLIAPAYAFFKKDRVAEQMGAPGRIKAPALDRVSYNAERASNAAQNRAISRSIDTSGAGPAGIMAKMATYRQKQEGDIKIAAQESRMNTQIANQEAQMEQQANVRNVANAMQADQINTSLREAQLAANEDRKLGAIDSFTERTAGLAGDLLEYQSTERRSRAIGDMGIYERDRLRNFLKNEINPRTKKPYTNADIAELFNKRFGKAQVTKEDDKKDKDE